MDLFGVFDLGFGGAGGFTDPPNPIEYLYAHNPHRVYRNRGGFAHPNFGDWAPAHTDRPVDSDKHPESDPHADRHRDANAHADGNKDTDRDQHANAHSDTHVDRDEYSYEYSHPDRHGDQYLNWYLDAQSNPDEYADRYLNAYADSDSHAHDDK
ncbi:MSCRAMM family adhesin SdrC [Patescibacteria group bacterium]|nr:MSCRAMM family adhesin SdrC [Patescibacteria group bacterium]